MRTAILYTRAATLNSQAEDSLMKQEELLKKYCKNNKIKVIEVLKENAIGNTLDRPEFTRMMKSFKKGSDKPNLLLFTSWDKLFRNCGDVLEVMKILEKHEIIPQAIDQPLDIAVPESLLVLALFVASPQIENARREKKVNRINANKKEVPKKYKSSAKIIKNKNSKVVKQVIAKNSLIKRNEKSNLVYKKN